MFIILFIYIKYLNKRTKWRAKKSPWLGLEPTKVITLEQGIMSRKEACCIEFVLAVSNDTYLIVQTVGELIYTYL